ncbi:carbohydrate kinase family protein [Candidatus Nomurabacteria bacterium]|nr:carbohydrate kinase family protein [Candidatus Nomurabacteria bacterium]
MTTKPQVQFMSIGDILIDAFIKLDPHFAHTEVEENETELCMPWGSKVPYQRVDVVKAVGNGPNAAASAARLGLSSASMCHVGNDEFGTDCIKALEKNGVVTDFVTTEEGQQTNYHYVLSLNAERTILIKHAHFTYDLKKQLADAPVPEWVYFTSVAENALPYHEEIAQWVQENNIKMAFQPGSYQIFLGYEKLKSIYEATELFFCNVEEARSILKPVIGNSAQDLSVEDLLKEMHTLGPNIVCITDGAQGAYAYDGEHAWFMPIYPDPAPPVDRTGAGDSFSSTFTSALALGHDIPTALSWGPINSMSVVQYIGAQEGLLSREKLEEYLAHAPENYVAKQLF